MCLTLNDVIQLLGLILEVVGTLFLALNFFKSDKK